ncbi:MAG TPA: Ig domain-containing protein, partial [Terriglobales bacterium]|nr:Ig domain-containing protein [Terriglobales bacterium]
CGGGGGGGGRTPAPVSFGITTASLPPATSGVPYSVTLTAAGGTPPYKWSILTEYPQMTGFKLSTDGVLSGLRPEGEEGMLTQIQFQVTDSSAVPQTTTRSLPIDVFGMRSYAMEGQKAVKYNRDIIAGGGVTPILWQSTGLPPGLTLRQNPDKDSTREFILAGIPSQAGEYQVSIQATDSGAPARTTRMSFPVIIQPEKLVLPAKALPTATVGQPYSYTVPVSGGVPPYTVYVLSLPPGLTYTQSNTLISGTPTTSGFYSAYIQVEDAAKQRISNPSLQLLVTEIPPAENNNSISNATQIYSSTYYASISALTDRDGNLAPDQDYYRMDLAPGKKLFVMVEAVTGYSYEGDFQSLLDPVIEILDANGRRLNTCIDTLDDAYFSKVLPIDATPNDFDDSCMQWTGDGYTAVGRRSVRVTAKIPGSSTLETIYIHVFDWRGDARPDMAYRLTVRDSN